MYFNCAALQVVHFFLKDENLLRSYTATPKFFWTLKLIFNILLKYSKIYHSILDRYCRYCTFLDIYSLHNKCGVHAAEWQCFSVVY